MDAQSAATEHLQQALEAAGGFLFLLRPAENGDYRCLWISGGVRHCLGYGPAEAMAPGWFARGVHPDDREPVAGSTPLAADDGRAVHELRFRHRDGSYRWFHQELRMTDEGNVAGIAVDITRRKQAERRAREGEALRRGLLRTAPEAILTADAAGYVREVNPAAEEIFGYAAEELVGRSFLVLFPEDRRERARDYLESLGATEVPGPLPSRRMRGVRRSGEEFPAEVSVFVHTVEGQRHVTGIVRDVGEREALEREREKVIRQLQEALTEVRSLRQILPICAQCKSVRDDKGYWHQVEAYFHSHSAVEFSHGICPHCTEALYGRILDDGDA